MLTPIVGPMISSLHQGGASVNPWDAGANMVTSELVKLQGEVAVTGTGVLKSFSKRMSCLCSKIGHSDGSEPPSRLSSL